MSGTPEWLLRARCRELGLAVDEFFPSKSYPSDRALAACRECPVAEECATDRGKDIGLRAGLFLDDQGRIVRPCALCERPLTARNAQQKYCSPCRTLREQRRNRPAWKVFTG